MLACATTGTLVQYSIATQTVTMPVVTSTKTIVPALTATQYAPHRVVAIIDTGIDDGWVNLRSCASTKCDVLDVLHDGDKIEIIARGTWHFVWHDGLAGYVYSEYVNQGE